MAFDYDVSNQYYGYIDGDNTKTLQVTAAAIDGRAALALCWAAAGNDAGTGVTYAGNAMTPMATTMSYSNTAFRAFYLSGDSVVPSGTQNFVFSASTQILARLVVVIVNGLDLTTPIVGTPIYLDIVPEPVNPIFGVGGDASWSGSVAFSLGIGNTPNYNTLTAGANSVLDFGGAPGYPQVFAGHRNGGNVTINFVSDHSDEFVLAAWSLKEPGGDVVPVIDFYSRQMGA